MSKIKIQGHASGTGVLTVTAPNTSTDRTITLPDATGTLLNSDGSGANLTSLPSGSQLVHSGTTQVETTATGAKIGSTSSTQTHLDITTNTASYGGVYFTDGADEAYRGAVQYKHGDDFMHMYTAGTERMRIHSNGVTSIPAGVALGVGTANTASNVLDDYEEGTWTATFSNASQSGGNFTGRYVKIGKSVTVWFSNGGGVISGSSGIAIIGGLPFTIQNSNGNYPVFSYIHGDAVTNCNGFHGDLNGTQMSAVTRDGTGYQSWVNGSKWVMITGTYEAQ
tara:strand:- start:60 stop:899 length:840 start_codon:yes stop_codon:yes gene_type:complete